MLYAIDRLTRLVRLYGKFFRRMQQLSSGNFALQEVSADLVLYYWGKVVEATNGRPEYIAGMFQEFNFAHNYLFLTWVSRLTNRSVPDSLALTGNGFIQGKCRAVGPNPQEWR